MLSIKKKENRHTANKHMKRCSTSVFRELQKKTTRRYHYTPIRTDETQSNNMKC